MTEKNNEIRHIKRICTPINSQIVQDLHVGDKIEVYGTILTGRDAVLPKLVDSIKRGQCFDDLEGSVIMHTAVSDAGISPTTSNKEEIEESIPCLAKSGVKIHIGKGSLGDSTVKLLDKYESIFAVTPPAAALLSSRVISRKVVAFENEGMEAIHLLEVRGIPCIVAAAHAKAIY
nr:fumarate hydratase C-terminal domain-containing protein [Methanobacterium spitsbergense]